MSSLLLQRPVTGLKMAINSWLEKLHELHPLSVKLLVLNDRYQWERCIVCNDIMAPACFLNLCEVKTWELATFWVCVSSGKLSNTSNSPDLFFSNSQINRLHWFAPPTAASALIQKYLVVK